MLNLTLRHGCKCFPDPTVSVEDCLIAIGEKVGASNIKSASRMNKAVVVFLAEVAQVDKLIETGLTINDLYLPVLPMSSLSKKVVLSNVPPFISSEMLTGILARYGKVNALLRMIPLGCKNPDMKHIMSFRRQTFMILHPQFANLNVSVKLVLEGKEYNFRQFGNNVLLCVW